MSYLLVKNWMALKSVETFLWRGMKHMKHMKHLKLGMKGKTPGPGTNGFETAVVSRSGLWWWVGSPWHQLHRALSLALQRHRDERLVPRGQYRSGSRTHLDAATLWTRRLSLGISGTISNFQVKAVTVPAGFLRGLDPMPIPPGYTKMLNGGWSCADGYTGVVEGCCLFNDICMPRCRKLWHVRYLQGIRSILTLSLVLLSWITTFTDCSHSDVTSFISFHHSMIFNVSFLFFSSQNSCLRLTLSGCYPIGPCAMPMPDPCKFVGAPSAASAPSYVWRCVK